MSTPPSSLNPNAPSFVPSRKRAKSTAALMSPKRQRGADRSPDTKNDLGWLQQAIANNTAPSIAIAYDHQVLAKGKSLLRCVPFKCVYPRLLPSQANLVNSAAAKDSFGEFDITYDEPTGNFNPTLPSVPSRRLSDSSTTDYEPLKPPRGGPSKEWRDATPLDTCRIPLEIFRNITQHLSRDDVRRMRLVDRNFEEKVSGDLFEAVVVPFNATIYGMLASATLAAQAGRTDKKCEPGTTMVDTSAGACADPRAAVDVFRGFGHRIHKFGMTFDVTHDDLAKPGFKRMLQNHEAYWGDFKWPFPDYPRFADRAGLEDAADETQTMKLAFSHLGNAKHLALSVDSGLGWFTGPDASIRQRILRRPLPLFGSSKFCTDPSVSDSRRLWSAIRNAHSQASVQNDLLCAELVHLVHDRAKPFTCLHSGSHLQLDSGLLSRTPQISLAQQQQEKPDRRRQCSIDAEILTALSQSTGLPDQVTRQISSLGDDLFFLSSSYPTLDADWDSFTERTHTAASPPQTSARVAQPTSPPASIDGRADTSTTPPRLTEWCSTESLDADVADDAADANAIRSEATPTNDVFPVPTKTDDKAPARSSGILFTRPISECGDGSHPSQLSPVQLTQQQKEWLMETAWAQDAFLSSYMLAVADNAQAFQNVASLDLAYLSSRHLPKFFRDDFWAGLPALESLRIRVIADWRDVRYTAAGSADLPYIDPSEAVRSFNYFLGDVVAYRKNITALDVGWAEGGEHSAGLLSRNRHLLPAPLMTLETVLTERPQGIELTMLPELTRLTLANCWITPVALSYLINSHVQHGKLRSVTLDSVSLTCPPRPVQNGAAANQALAFPAAPAHAAAAQALQFWQQVAAVPHGSHLALLNLFRSFANAAPAQFQAAAAQAQQAGVAFHAAMGLAFNHHFAQQIGDATQQQAALATFAQHAPTPAQIASLLANAGAAAPAVAAPAGGGQNGNALVVPRWPPPTITTAVASFPGHQNFSAAAAAAAASQPVRDGSWPHVIAQLRATALRYRPCLALRFLSCGHAKLRQNAFDQSPLREAEDLAGPAFPQHQAFFSKRAKALEPLMLSSTDPYLGEIVAAWPAGGELEALEARWPGLRRGWPTDHGDVHGHNYHDDHDDDRKEWGRWSRESSEAAEFDGRWAGGTGRFSGRIDGFEGGEGEAEGGASWEGVGEDGGAAVEAA